MYMIRKIVVFVALFLAVPIVWASGDLIELIDTPTAEQVDHYGYFASFRMYTDGGVLTKAVFGVLPRVNIGFGLDIEKLIGQSSVDINRPSINLKLRFFDGEDYLPALALGYDGQGYFFNENTNKYIQREKGLYLAASNEYFMPNLELHGGGNIYDFKKDVLHGFAGLSYTYEDVVSFLFELDNIRLKSENRMNAGIRYFLTPTLAIDMVGRDLGAAGRKAERIIKVNYLGSF